MLIHRQNYKDRYNESHMRKFHLNTVSTCGENSKSFTWTLNLSRFSKEREWVATVSLAAISVSRHDTTNPQKSENWFMHELFLRFKCFGVKTYQNHISEGIFSHNSLYYQQLQCFSESKLLRSLNVGIGKCTVPIYDPSFHKSRKAEVSVHNNNRALIL